MSLSTFPNNHPLSFPLGLFFLGCCVSLFPNRIRHFAIALPLEKHRSRTRERKRHRLFLLRSLHQNAYGLLLYTLWTVVSTCLFIAGAVVLDSLLVLVVFRKADLRLMIVAPCIFGIVISKAIEFRRLLSQLDSFDRSTEVLEAGIRQLSALEAFSEVLG